MNAYVFLMALLIQNISGAQALDFSAETCKDFHRITRELIDLELSGQTWQGGDSPCLKQERFKTVLAKKADLGDPYLLEPEYILPKNRTVMVTSEKIEDTGYIQNVHVKIAYRGKKAKKDEDIEDGFSYQINYGKNRARGCATVIESMQKFVMKAECHYQ